MSEFATPEKTPQIASVPAPAQGPAPKPKTPLVSAASDIHSGYIEHGATCDVVPTSAGCFLSSGQRSRLVNGYQHRVIAAQAQYVAALEELRLDTLIEKDDDLAWVVSLVLDVAGLYSISLLGKAAKWLRDGPGEHAIWALKVADVHLGSTSIATQAIEMMQGVSDQGVDATVRAILGQGKAKVVAAAKTGAAAGARDRGVDAISYLDTLKNESASLYEALREQPPGTATDAELILLFQSFEADLGHTIGAYKEQLTAKVARYRATRIGDLGRGRASHLTPVHDEDADRADAVKTESDADTFQQEHGAWRWPAIRELKVAWLRNRSSPNTRLVYVRQDFDLTLASSDPRAPLDASPLDERPHQLEDVEQEFIDVAIQRHRAVWGREPETIVNDDLAWTSWSKGSRAP